MFQPKVSIIIPVYNCEKYIEECIDSVFLQTYPNMEVFCIDNDSTDNSYEVIKKIKEEKYPNLIIGKVPNIYPFCWDEPRDEAFKQMTGDYFIIIASDDYIDKNFIKKYIEIFSKAPNKILAIQSPIMGINNGNKVGLIKNYYKNLTEMKKQLLIRSVVNTPTVMYNRKIYDKGLFVTKPLEFSGAGDYEFYCNLADQEIMIFPMPEWVGYYYRWHDQQATWGMQKLNVKYDLIIQNKWKDRWKKI
jgi:glycosyltransferase involved in cell wall biosynthesis